MTEFTRKTRLGVVGVDSGQLILMDPSYIQDIVEADSGAFYEEVCRVTGAEQGGQLKYAHGDDGLAVAFTSGFGDGTYEVWAYYVDGGDSWGERIGKVEIILTHMVMEWPCGRPVQQNSALSAKNRG